MLKLDKQPSEAIYEIVLTGKFNPQKFHPQWFAKKKLLGKKEANKANDDFIVSKKKAFFTTKYLRISVEKKYFRITAKQLVFWDVAEEFAVNVSKILAESLDNGFLISSVFHFTFKSEKKMLKVLNNFNQNQKVWASILENSQLDELEISEETITKYGWMRRNVSLSVCGREDMENTIHLYVTTISIVDLEKTSLYNAIIEDEDTLKNNLVVVNKIINAYF